MSAAPRVLVVDDDADMQMLMAALLEHLGAATTTAGAADEVQRALDPPPDLVLLDLVMPPGVFEAVVDLLAARAAGTPIALLSGSDQHTLDNSRKSLQARGLRVDNALVKPVRLDALATLLASTQTRSS